MINCIILDDEEHAIELLKLHIEQTPFLKLVGAATDPIKALELLNSKEIHLLFLDIQMPGMTGLEFMQLLNGKCKVILTTAFREYALQGFEHNVVDYLLKPIVFSRFYKAAQRAQEVITAPAKETEDYILVKTEYKGKLLRIKINDIIYIEGMGKYVRFHIRNSDPVMALLTISGLEEKLSRDRFVRIHKSFIIALPFLQMINGNRVHLEFTNEHLPIGQSYRDAFMSQMREKVITNKPANPGDD
ncbi:response regulator transcription factor [Rhodocytophaga aerolata]|uniref:Response regulator transcription factor n=1 Tax=Rhodocytophaga aerolata TaxID=455078 RepID=A0ABT8RHQ9_9BACT|nr:response regulator transcription factor [Rhodocytophaga aerolata]MDO1450703.1 response regulator transcription factor [Rhodocytophaga aerolata]